MSERQIEMLWKCSSCGHRSLGRHGTCQSCNNPKDGSEEWFMPEGPAPTVTDPALLALAHAGANWRCGYCGSDQRAGDGGCAQCGAARKDGASLDAAPARPQPALPQTSAAAPAVSPQPKGTGWRAHLPVVFWRPLIALWVVGVTFLGLLDWSFPKRATVEASVAGLRWARAVLVERKQQVPKEGFAEQRPVTAEQVTSLGPRHHHDDQVADGTRTESYTVQVSDGYTTETYSEEERCGETCTRSAPTCTEVCTPNKNGFATCKTKCSGGGRDCTPKYCKRTKTRSKPKTKTERRTREVTNYKTVPREAEYFSWKEWAWLRNRTIDLAGTTEPPRWPAPSALAPAAALGPGEEERAQSRSETYEVTFAGSSGGKWKHLVPTEAEFLRFKVGARHLLQAKGDTVTAVDPIEVSPSVVPLRFRPQFWFPVVVVLGVALVGASRRWPRWQGTLFERFASPRLQLWARRLRLRHLLGLLGLFLGHAIASHPLEFAVEPGRGLYAISKEVDWIVSLANPKNWEQPRWDEVSTWVVLTRARWTALCSTDERTADGKWATVAERSCAGEGPPPALPPRAAGCEGGQPPAGCRLERRSGFHGIVSLVRLPSGASIDGATLNLRGSERAALSFQNQFGANDDEEHFAKLAASSGRLYSALVDDGRSSSGWVTLRTDWPEP